MIESFKKIINPEVSFNLCGQTNKEIHVKEDSNSSSIKKLIINSMPNDSFSFTLDFNSSKKSSKSKYNQLSCYLNKATGDINKSCDLVILSSVPDGCINVDLIDLKSNSPQKKKSERQLGNSEVFIKYLSDLVSYHYKIRNKLNFRKSVIYTCNRKMVNKNRTYRATSTRNDIQFISVTPNSSGVASLNFGKFK